MENSLPTKAGGTRCWFNPWVGKIPWNRKWQLTPVFLPGKAHGQRSLAGYSPWGCKSQTLLSNCPATTVWEHVRKSTERFLRNRGRWHALSWDWSGAARVSIHGALLSQLRAQREWPAVWLGFWFCTQTCGQHGDPQDGAGGGPQQS